MSAPPKTTTNVYLYDPLDRLVNTHSSQRFYNGTRIATEIQGERKTCFFEHEAMPLAELHPGEAVTLLATDQQTSVLNSVSPALSQLQSYGPYGHRPTTNGLLNLLGFNGERPDPVTGHYLLGQGYRAFNPVLMRFNSPDSFSPFGRGGINCYAYCSGDPINFMDPGGHARFGVLSGNLFEIFGKGAQMGGAAQVKTLTKFKEIHPGIYSAQYTAKNGKQKLLINGHGLLHPDDPQKGVMLGAGLGKSDYIDAPKLKRIIEAAGYKDYSSIRLMVCYSGDGTSSLGKSLSQEVGVPVTAYKGVVTSYASPYWVIKKLKSSDYDLNDAHEVLIPHNEFIVKRSSQIRSEDRSKTAFQAYQPVKFL
ncbi:RHS repeat-associated core domain-containing protein [Pseudomonas lundensis]|uniref:RHS repeat-associated core domain-containing protein n=1 Tax=Pseudomonas lundensis TaxID=86185 RepID=UPI0009F73790|nr:RHS repeat-associated core domain-containing protein [Pseudomonas lundensis]